MRAKVGLAGALAAVTLCAGCVGALPIPTAKHTPRKYGTRGEIEPRALEFVGPETTRADVLLRLGEPDVVGAGERYFFYCWITARGRVPAWAAGNSTSQGEVWSLGKRRHDLVFEFDDRGRVLRHGDVREWHASGAGTHRETGEPPLEIEVGRRQDTGFPNGARLRIGDGTLQLTGDADAGPDLTLERGDVVKVRWGSRQDHRWLQRIFALDLTYRDATGELRPLQMFVTLEDLPPLLDRLRESFAEASFES